MLPKTQIPCSELELPISKKKVRVRALTTKEEKVLLIHKEASDETGIELAIRDLIEECTFKKLNVDNLDLPDLVAIFLKIIEMSKGGVVTHEYICRRQLEDENGKQHECGNIIRVDINLNEVQYSELKFPSNIVELTDDIKVEMKRLSPDIIQKAIDASANDIEYVINLVVYSIISIINKDEVYNEFTPEEVYDWVMDLSMKQTEKLVLFTQDIPSVYLKHTVTCDKCGNSQEIVLKGLNDFFPNGFLAII